MVLLVIGWHLANFSSVIYILYDLCKVGWTIKIDPWNSISIAWDNFFNAITFWLKNISVNRKTMGSSSLWGNSSAKPIARDLFIRVIILKDTTNWLNSLNVLISLWILTMQRVVFIRGSIGQCEIDCNTQIDLASTKHILQKVNISLDFKFVDCQNRLIPFALDVSWSSSIL
jgi:hypothetical protein